MPGSVVAPAIAPAPPRPRFDHGVSTMYVHLMVTTTWPFRVDAGPEDAVFHEAWVEMSQRGTAGVHVALEPGKPWRWVGQGGPVDASLVDVLAAINYARLEGVAAANAIDVQAIQAHHQQATAAAVEADQLKLARRLVDEQAEVAVPNLVDEHQLQELLGYKHAQSVLNLRLNRPRRRICPPIYIPKGKRISWGWSRAQLERWIASRRGKGWRRGQTAPSGWDAIAADRRPRVQAVLERLDQAEPHSREWATAMVELADLVGTGARVGDLRGRSRQTGTAWVQEARSLLG